VCTPSFSLLEGGIKGGVIGVIKEEVKREFVNFKKRKTAQNTDWRFFRV